MRYQFFTALTLCVGLAGCGTLGSSDFGLEEKIATSEYSAAQVNLSTFRPILWSSVVDDLKPKFGINSASELLDDVAPVVGRDDARISSRIAVEIAAQLAGTTINNTTTKTRNEAVNAAGDKTVTSSNNSTETTNKVTPDAITVEPNASNSSIPSYETIKDISTGFNYDPDLQYRSATALFQNIQLLDKYLDANLSSETQDAFLMRVQLTVNPYAHLQPYDVYTLLTFYFSEKESVGSPNSGNILYNSSNAFRIYPLIIADNLERTDTSQIAETLSAIQLSLSGSAGIFSAGGGVQSALNQLRTLVGANLNSLVTYSQPDHQSLSIRMGAPFNARSGYAMRARTYDITFVMVIDNEELNKSLSIFEDIENQRLIFKEDLEISIFAETDMRHARTGKRLPGVSNKDIEYLSKQVHLHWKNMGCITLFGDFDYNKCPTGHYTKEGDRKDFMKIYNNPHKFTRGVIFHADHSSSDILNSLHNDKPNLANGWLYRELYNARTALVGSYSTIYLQDTSKEKQLPDMQTGLYSDNGSLTTVQLSVPDNTVKQRTKGMLYFNNPDAGTYLHTSVRSEKGLIVFQFPSLRALGLQHLKPYLNIEMDGDNEYYTLAKYKSSAEQKKARSFGVTMITKQFNEPEAGDDNGVHARFFLHPSTGQSINSSIDAFRVTIKNEPLKAIRKLNDEGDVSDDGSVKMVISKNAARIKSLGAAHVIELKTAEIPKRDIEFTVEGLDQNGNVVQGEVYTGKFSAP